MREKVSKIPLKIAIMLSHEVRNSQHVKIKILRKIKITTKYIIFITKI
jgi:hypothetical protein